MDDYIDKYNLKSEGLSLEKQDSEKAIEFYNELLNNELFANDYYPYRRLVLMYKKTKNTTKQIEIIKKFFKSGIYANEYQTLWFENKLRILNEHDVDDYIDYFNEHSLKNKNLANTPVPIADRIRKSRGKVFVESEEKYNKIQTQYAYEEKCSQLNRERKYHEYVDLLNHMIDDLNYNRYRYFQKLCIAYRRLDDKDNELRVIEKYMNGESTRTKASDEWFENRLKGIENPQKKVMHTIESQTQTDTPLLEYDKSLSQRENLKRKYSLIEYGQKLMREERYNDAIIFYKYLSNNSYFSNDYYPYRRLTIIYDRLNEYNANLVNIKKLLYSKIYLNHYQYIWFSEKLRQLSEKTDIDDFTLQKWFDYYLSHGALNKSKINRFLADRFIKSDDKFEILSVKEFIHRQEYCARLETGKIHERVGNLEFAIRHYTDMIYDEEYNYVEVYRMLLECHKKTGNDAGVNECIRLYHEIPPRDKNPESDRYFEENLKPSSPLSNSF